MLGRYVRLLVAVLTLLHFAGVTQLVSAYARDKASYVNMLSVNEEEEGKKEQDNTEDNLLEAALNSKYLQQPALLSGIVIAHSAYQIAEPVQAQYIGDKLTPPPNSLV